MLDAVVPAPGVALLSALICAHLLSFGTLVARSPYRIYYNEETDRWVGELVYKQNSKLY